jgi:hypothetical protein
VQWLANGQQRVELILRFIVIFVDLLTSRGRTGLAQTSMTGKDIVRLSLTLVCAMLEYFEH